MRDGGVMSLKNLWKRNVEEYSRDCVFRHRFAIYSEEEFKLWSEALYENKIVFKGTDKAFHIPDFSRIDYSGPETEHPEWVQQLNRFRWIIFAHADYLRNGSDHMARLVYDSINAWMEYWPNYEDRTDIYPFRQHELWDPMMSTPIRIGFNEGCGWVGCLPAFFDHPLFTEEFVKKVYDSVIWQLKPMLYNNMERSGEHNWRPNELDCLLFVSSVFPDAAGYKEYAVNNINDTFEAQFENDGSHIEHTPDYHNWLTDNFVLFYFMSKNRPELGLEIDGNKLVRAIDYTLDSLAPDGRSFGIHDSWPWHPDNAIIDDTKIRMRRKIAEEEGIQPLEEYQTVMDSYYPDAGHFFMRNGREADSTMFFFDATRWGSWHCHLSRNSVNMYHGGRMLLMDNGSLNYGKNAIRSYGKFTTSHNTITINGLSQCIYANPEILEYSINGDVALVVSSYQGGYQAMEGEATPVPAEHERIFIWVRDRFALVFDCVNIYNNNALKNIACHWQLPEGQVLHDSENRRVNTLFDDANVLLQCIYSTPEAESFIHEGEEDPLLGYVSRTGGKLSGGKPAPLFASEINTDAEFSRFCHIIVPYTGTGVPKVSADHDKTRYAMKFNIKIDSEEYEVASHYFAREYFKSNSAIRRIGDLDTFSRVYVKGKRNGEQILEWKYRGE